MQREARRRAFAARDRIVVTQFGLILAIELSGLAFAILLGRWLLHRDSGGGELRRVGGALSRAIDAFLREEGRAIALVAGGLAAVSFGAHAALAPSDGVLTRVEIAFWAALSLGLGAASTTLMARIAAKTALAATIRVVAAARESTDAALSVAVRSGGVLGLAAEAASVLALGIPLSLLFAMKGGFGAPTPELTSAVVTLAPGFALGAVAAALVVQRAGAVFHGGSDVGADLGGERDAGLPHDDPKNPALVADLVGDHVGNATHRTVNAFVSACLGNVTLALLAAALISTSPADPKRVALVFLPLVVRALGLVASGFGIMVVRTEEAREVTAALWRGQATAGVITLGGLVGAASWLLGDAGISFVWAGVSGLLGLFLLAHVTRVRLDKRLLPLREVLEALRVGDAPAVAQGLSAGFGSSWPSIAILGATMALSHHLGVASGVTQGGLLGPVVAMTTMLAASPFLVALGTFGPIADAARGIATMTSTATTPDGQRRVARLDDAGPAARAVSQSCLLCVAAVTAVLAQVTFFTGQSEGGVNMLRPSVLWCGALGFSLTLAYASHGMWAAAQGARSMILETTRQLRAFPRERGKPRLPADFTPSYKACIEVGTRAAFHRLVPAVLAVLALPALLFAVLWFGHREPTLIAESLTAFVLVAAVTGLGFALSLDFSRMTLSAARRHCRLGPDNADFHAALGADAVMDLVGRPGASSALLAVQAAAATVLVTCAFLFF